MRLALKELRRRPGRFGVATVILTLIAILLMFLGGLLDGLTAGNTGAIRAQQADLIVYSETSQDSLVRSRIDPEQRRDIEVVKTGPMLFVRLHALLVGELGRYSFAPPVWPQAGKLAIEEPA